MSFPLINSECQARLNALTAASTSSRDVADARASEAKARVELTHLRQELETLRGSRSSNEQALLQQIESTREELKAVSESMDGLAVQYEGSEDSNRRLVLQGAERESLHSKVLQEQLMAQQKTKKADEMLSMETKKALKWEELIKEQKQHQASQEVVIKTIRTALAAKMEQFELIKQQMDTVKIERDDGRKIATHTHELLEQQKKAFASV
jgi:hypothetical protein